MVLKLAADPTFKGTVEVRVIGKDELVPIEITYKHRTQDEFTAYLKKSAEAVTPTAADEADAVMEVASNWGLVESFTRENVIRLCQAYPGIAVRIVRHYFDVYSQARLGN